MEKPFNLKHCQKEWKEICNNLETVSERLCMPSRDGYYNCRDGYYKYHDKYPYIIKLVRTVVQRGLQPLCKLSKGVLYQGKQPLSYKYLYNHCKFYREYEEPEVVLDNLEWLASIGDNWLDHIDKLREAHVFYYVFPELLDYLRDRNYDMRSLWNFNVRYPPSYEVTRWALDNVKDPELHGHFLYVWTIASCNTYLSDDAVQSYGQKTEYFGKLWHIPNKYECFTDIRDRIRILVAKVYMLYASRKVYAKHNLGILRILPEVYWHLNWHCEMYFKTFIADEVYGRFLPAEIVKEIVDGVNYNFFDWLLPPTSCRGLAHTKTKSGDYVLNHEFIDKYYN